MVTTPPLTAFVHCFSVLEDDDLQRIFFSSIILNTIPVRTPNLSFTLDELGMLSIVLNPERLLKF